MAMFYSNKFGQKKKKKNGNLLSSLPNCHGKEVAFITKVMHRDRNKLPEP